MITRKLSVALFLALGASVAGCATSTTGDPGDGSGSGSGSGSDPGTGAIPLSAQGKFTLQSDYDIASNMPGTAGDVITNFIDATDDPDDPTKYIVDKLIAALPSGTLKNAVSSAAPFVTGYLNDRLLDIAPDFVTRILDIGDKFGQIAKHFGTLETLEVDATGKATHTVSGVHFKVDTTELDFAFTDYQLQDVVVPNVQVTLDQTGKLTIAAHKVPLSYGKLLRLGLDNVVIPMIDPSAVTLDDLLQGAVDCGMVGEYVYEALGFGSPSTFQSACTAGLSAAGTFIYSQIDKIDASALEFDETGTAKGVDKTGDGKLDAIQTGKWGGTLGYAGTPAPLATATFFGAKQ